ncbi:MAG: hypothetical protein RL375_4467 [Pseudomonadota bacterium]
MAAQLLRCLVPVSLSALLGVALAAPAATVTKAADQLPIDQAINQGGIRARLQIGTGQSGPVPRDQPLEVAISLTDDVSGEPLRGLRPRLWMSRQGSENSCVEQVRRFAGGRLAQRADRDLNGFQFLTLNADASVSVINPLIALNNTKLEALIPLPGVGSDWVHAAGRDLLFITLAERGELAVVDLTRNRLVKSIKLGAGQPRRLLLSADARLVWVAMDQSARLVAVNVDRLEIDRELDIGEGLHMLAQTEDGRRLVATSSTAGRVTIIDATTRTVTARLDLAGSPLAVTYSALARRAFVATSQSPLIHVIDPDGGRIDTSLAAPTGITALRADPGGRHVLGLSGVNRQLVTIDAATRQATGVVTLKGEADQIAFSRNFAYLRSPDSLSLTLVDLKSLGEGRIATSEVPFFQRLPSTAAQHIGPGDIMAASPEQDSLIVASPADTALYYYTEGMMAPQGSYQTYRRAPRALMVVDRSLRETSPGRYSATVRLDRGGHYSLPLLIEQPRVVHCFGLEVDDSGPTSAHLRGYQLDFSWPPGHTTLRAGEEHELVVEIKDIATGKPVGGLKDLQVMALELPGISQLRRRADEVAPGRYLVKQRLPRGGKWRLSAQSVSLGLKFDESTSLDVAVQEVAGVADAQDADTTAADAAPQASPTSPAPRIGARP